MARDVDLIVIHCSASAAGVPLMRGDARAGTLRSAGEVIDQWHGEPLRDKDGRVLREHKFERQAWWVQRFNPRLRYIGYHHVIDVGGPVESGRHHDEVGAHAQGWNQRSIGVCMVGMHRFDLGQWEALARLVEQLLGKYKAARVRGHRDCSPDRNGDGKIERWEWLKECPTFDVAEWMARGMEPRPEHVFEGGAK